MKSILILMVASVLVLFVGASVSQITFKHDQQNQLEKQSALHILSSMPLVFTENRGQFGEKTLFKAEVGGATFFFCRDEVTYLFIRETDGPIEEDFDHFPGLDQMMDIPAESRHKTETVQIKAQFVGASLNPEVAGVERLPHNNNYFFGDDPTKWQKDVPNYSAILYTDIYNGIDLKYYGDGSSMKYDFIVQPGADISQIKIRYGGVKDMAVTPAGNLQVQTSFGPVQEKAPYVYQEVAGKRRELAGRYEMIEPGIFSFVVDKSYNPSYPLVIDPVIVYSTYLGGTNKDWSFDIAVDPTGYAYVTGYTWSVDYDVSGGLSYPYAAGKNAFITKISLFGLSLVYSTYLGGENDDWGFGIAVDNSVPFCAYIAGYTESNSFPKVSYHDNTLGGVADGFVAKLSQSGNNLEYSTYLGGSNYDACHAIAVDGSGCAHVTGMTYSTDFDAPGSPYQGNNDGYWDVFVTKLSSLGNSLTYSTYLGGSYIETGNGIALDNSGFAYVTGWTWSDDFDVSGGLPGNSHKGGKDAFITKLSLNGAQLVYSTYLGGSNDDYGKDIAVDLSGNAYVTGRTGSGDFPKQNPYDNTLGGALDAFVTKISSTGSAFEYSTYLGGSDVEHGNAITVDSNSRACVTGWTGSTNFSLAGNPHQATKDGGYDAYVTKFSSAGNSLLYSTYLGGSDNDYGYGIAVDSWNNIYVTGKTESFDFDTTPTAYQPDYEGNYDAFVAKFLTGITTPPIASIDYINPNPAGTGVQVNFNGLGTPSLPTGNINTYDWYSDIDGHLSSASSFSRNDLPEGTHNIYFRVKTIDGVWSTNDIVTLEITGSKVPPTATINSITPNPAGPGVTVNFSGQGADPDGTDVINSYEWYSSIDGILSSISSFNTNTLSSGAHTILFKVQDNEGAWSKNDKAYLSVIAPIGEEWEISTWFSQPAEYFSIKMYDSYICTLLVTNITQVDQVFNYGLNYSFERLNWFDDSVNGYGGELSCCSINGTPYSFGSSLSETIPPDETREYIITHSNEWDWIDDWGLGRIALIVLGVAFSAADGNAAFVAGEAYDWYLFFQTVQSFLIDSAPKSEYTYNGFNDLSVVSYTPQAYVTEEKVLFFWDSYLLGDIASDLTSAGFTVLSSASGPQAPIIAAAFFIAEAILYGCSERLYLMAVDPSTDYTTIVYSAEEWDGPHLGDIDPGWWRDMAVTSLSMYMVSDACYKSYARYLGAVQDNSMDWAIQQLGATNGYLKEMVSLTQELKSIIDDNILFFDELECDIPAI